MPEKRRRKGRGETGGDSLVDWNLPLYWCVCVCVCMYVFFFFFPSGTKIKCKDAGNQLQIYSIWENPIPGFHTTKKETGGKKTTQIRKESEKAKKIQGELIFSLLLPSCR